MLASISRRKSGRDTETSKLMASKPRETRKHEERQAKCHHAPATGTLMCIPSTRPMPSTVGVRRRAASRVTYARSCTFWMCSAMVASVPVQNVHLAAAVTKENGACPCRLGHAHTNLVFGHQRQQIRLLEKLGRCRFARLFLSTQRPNRRGSGTLRPRRVAVVKQRMNSYLYFRLKGVASGVVWNSLQGNT